MKNILDLTLEELHKIAEIVTGHKCTEGWYGVITPMPAGEDGCDQYIDHLEFTWAYFKTSQYSSDREELMVVTITIKEDYDIWLYDVGMREGDVHFGSYRGSFSPINLVKYVNYINSLS